MVGCEIGMVRWQITAEGRGESSGEIKFIKDSQNKPRISIKESQTKNNTEH